MNKHKLETPVQFKATQQLCRYICEMYNLKLLTLCLRGVISMVMFEVADCGVFNIIHHLHLHI